MEVSTSPKAVLERLKQGTGSKNDKELAAKLGVAPQSIYNVTAKNRLPDGWVRKMAEDFNLSADWLYFGEGNMYRTGEINNNPCPVGLLDRQVVLDVVEVLEEFLENANKKLPAKAKAELIYQLYALVHEEENDNRQPIRMFKLIQGALAANS